MPDKNDLKLRKAYIDRLSARIDGWDADLKKLQARARESSADMEIAVRKSIKQITKNRDDVAKRMKQLASAGGDAWASLRKQTDDAVDVVEKAFEKVRSRFS